MSEPGARIQYEFNDFRLDPQQRLLLTAAGEPVPLQPKVFDTLLYFIERRGELLDKTTLMKAIWPNVVVEENSLNQNISALRRALREAPGEHRFIVTEPGRGYRWVADVRTAAAVSGEPARVESAPRPAERKSIAVLPFANLTGDASKDYLGDGLAEELIHTLARIPGLKVPSRTSSFAYKGRNTDVRQIARDLDVGAVLEGSVRAAGERIRVTAQLIDGANGFHRWSQSYDRDFGDLFRLQDELAHAIVSTLRLTLEGRTPGAGLQVQPTQNLEAYHLYLQAMALQGGGLPSMQRAYEMLTRALAIDPKFARAHSALATLRAIALVLGVPLFGDLEEVERQAQQAVAMDPTAGATHGALATIQIARGKWIAAEDSFQAALVLDDADPYLHQSYALFLAGSAGLLRQSLAHMLKANQLAPAWAANLLGVAVAYATLGQDEEATRFLDLALDFGLNVVLGPIADMRSQIDMRRGRFDEAVRRFDGRLSPAEVAAGMPEAIVDVFGAIRGGVARAAAIEKVDALWTRLGPESIPQPVKRRFMVWYTLLGAMDQAYAVMTQSLDQFARSGTIGTAWGFLWMPDMQSFRRDARFQALVARLGLPAYWDRFGPPDGCEWRNGKLICG
jgi:TolB-like protein/Tfp pilus assembly protein PilF